MGKYKKRKDGRYATQILIGYKDDGKRDIKTLYGRTIAELDKKVLEFRTLLEQGVILDAKNYTLKSWTIEWFDLYGSKGLRDTTKRGKKSDLNHITQSPIADLPIKKIRVQHLQQLINTIFDNAPSKISKIHHMLVNIFDSAIKNNIIVKNIVKDVEIPKYTYKTKRALSTQEQIAFRTADLTLQERVFVDLSLDCGLRKGEILALSLNDFDIKGETVSIHKTYDIGKKIIYNNPKTVSGNRTVPVTEKMIKNIMLLSKENNSLQLFLFRGKPLTQKKFVDMWNNIINKVIGALDDKQIVIDNISTKDLTAHYLRHTFATNMFYAGIDIKAAQYLMGHSNIETTLKIYTHLQLNNDDIKSKLHTYITDMSVSQKSVSVQDVT